MKAGIPAFEKTQKYEFVNFYSLTIKCRGEEGKTKKKKTLTKRRLKLADKRLKAAKSNDLKKRVEKTIWIELFLKEVQSAQMRLDESQRLTENATRE